MTKVKKALALVLVLTLVFLVNTAAFAAVHPEKDAAGPEPRLQYFIFVGANISVTSSGGMECTGDFATYEPQKVKLTVSLQRSKDGKTWSNVSGAKWSETINKHSGMTYGTSDPVDRLYNYRTKTVAQVLDTKGSTLETVTVYSQTQVYSLDTAYQTQDYGLNAA